MTQVFSGLYFDGSHAGPQKAEIIIRNGRLEITLPEKGLKKTFSAPDLSGYELAAKDRIIIRAKGYPQQLLDIRSSACIDLFRQHFPHVREASGPLQRIFQSGYSGLLFLLLFVAGMLTAFYVYGIPYLGDIAARLFPVAYEKQLGESLYGQMIRQYTVDSTQTQLANELAKEIDFQSDYEMRFTVVTHDQKNAFALPGGHIVIFSGILYIMEDYTELAGLMAHEAAHVHQRHTLRVLFRSLSSYILISLIFNDITGIIVDNVHTLRKLAFSRSFEREADLEGLRILAHNHIDPEGMLRLFEHLMEATPAGSEPEFLRTHPLTRHRIQYLQEAIRQGAYPPKSSTRMQEIWERMQASLRQQ
ncbi:MAG: hypothetical protein KatS3mg031_0567 [Chitinophagales bacterium]|nr:MAG: hypothetical protein KatS3mg031_0567 [Chitinophagales bacterium]